MTDESLNLDISKLLPFADLRRKRTSYRRVGKRPPEQVNVNITVESYDLIRSLAVAKGHRHSPFYEEVDQLVKEYFIIKDKLSETEFLLQDSRQDKNDLKQRLDQVKLDISKLNDLGVILP